jgi:hypothetical protein
MSDDLINQLTLNFLISKQQLQKLNKKTKETADQTKLREIEEYNDRIKKLFSDLLVCQPPDDLLFEVKNTFDNFIEKAIYYFKAHDNNDLLERERSKKDIQEDIDYEKEEREIEKGNYKEIYNKDENEEDEEDEEDEQEEEEEDEEQEEEQNEEQEDEDIEILDYGEEGDVEENKYNSLKTKKTNITIHEPVIVKSKYNKTTNSIGVDDIQKLPLDWFQSIRQNYKKNQIIPRKKEPTIVGQPFRKLKKKI